MTGFRARCLACDATIDVPADVESVVCPSCDTPYRVLAVGNTITLAPVPLDYLAELDQDVEEVRSAIQELKSREQAAPLQIGCGLFAIFGLVVVVLGLFATVARSLFGSWFFYFALAAVVLLGVWRMSKKLTSSESLRQIRNERIQLELRLVQLEEERASVLKQREGPDFGP